MAPKARAGANADGVLLLHAATSVTYTTDTLDYCGQSGLTDCSEAIVTLAADPATVTVFYLIAAFPEFVTPQLTGVNFGLTYSTADFVLLDSGLCADQEFPTSGWPDTGTGNAVLWIPTRTDHLIEVYWFAGYAYSEFVTTTVAIGEHPDHGLNFSDDSVPAVLDPVYDTGQLGFGVSGTKPNCGYFSGTNAPESSSQFTFIELAVPSSTTFMDQLRELREDYGLDVHVGLSPDALFCATEAGTRQTLANDPRVSLVTNKLIPGELPVTDAGLTGGDAGFARRVWNSMLQEAPADTGGGTFFNPDDGCLLGGEFSPGPDEPEEQTSLYMAGDIGISLLYMESEDSRVCENPDFTENWTTGERNFAIVQITTGLRQLREFAPTEWLTFVLGESPVCATSVEPIRLSTAVSDTWKAEALEQLGYTGGAVLDMTFELNNDRRSTYGTDWWYTIYLVRDVCDQDHRFENGYASMANVNGPSMILLYINGFDYPANELYKVAVHESCHIFGARDEYSTLGTCTGPYGYLRAEHQNRVGCSTNHPCIMRDGDTFAVCPYTKDQLGWHDTDGDGSFDPIDHPSSDRSMTIGDQDPLILGDHVDVFSDGIFHRRLSASQWSSSEGRVLWDGIGFDGLPRPTGSYFWTRNGGASHALTLDTDVEDPVISDLTVTPGGGPGDNILSFRFLDSDTKAGRVHAVASPKFPGTSPSVEIMDQFYVDSSDLVDPHSKRFVLGHSGVYDLSLKVWDVGFGSSDTETIEFWHGPTSGAEEPSLYVPEIRLSPSRPNPTRGWVTWELDRPGSRQVDLSVVAADGRRVRSWGQRALPEGRTRILWDGRDDSGRRVAAGRYFLLAVNESGQRTSVPATLIK